MNRPDPHTEAAISGDPPRPTREADLLKAGHTLARIAHDLGDHAHRYALQDLIDYLTGHLGAPGTAWPVRLPVPDTTGGVVITQERLDQLEARAGVCWGNR